MANCENLMVAPLLRSTARVAALCVLLVIAQSTIAAPPSPGAVRGNLPAKKQLQTPADSNTPVIEAPKPKKRAIPASTKTIRVQQFLINGNTAISTSDLLREVEPFIGQDLTLADLYTVADVLTDHYRAKGYTLAQVLVPAQRVEAGSIRLEVVEGKINAVKFENNKSYRTKFLEPFFSGVKPGTVVSASSLERELLILNDLPGMTSRALVQPGPEYGTTDLVISTEEDRFEGRISANNYGRQDIGEWRVEGEVTINNPLRYGDRLSVIGIHSESNLLNYISGDYSISLNSKGTRANATVSYFDYSVGGDFSGLDIDGNNFYSHILISHPVKRTRRSNVLIGAGVGYNHSREETLGEKTKDNALVVFDINVLANWLHKKRAFSTARITASSNFQDNTDGTDNEALEGKLEIELDHLRSLAPRWFVYARLIGVYSADPLPDTEKANLGGVTSIRGFPSSELRGDTGGLLTLELRHQLPVWKQVSTTLSAFWDAGETNRIDAPPGVDSWDSLTSIGLGLTVSYLNQYVMELSAAKPTNDRDVSDTRNDGRIWVNLSAYF